MCEERENLVAFLYDEVDANERRSVEQHLSNCEDCREELRGFRNVRQDLLAWDVPPHESVWKPFVTARPQPVWRQVPAWSLAAAATLVFAIGGAGGFAARALTSRMAAADQVAGAQAPNRAPGVVPTSATPASSDEVRALETRLAELERAASQSGAAPVSLAASQPTSNDAILAKVEQLIRDSEGRVNHRTAQKIMSIMQDLGRQRTADNAMLLQQISDAQDRVNGSILQVKNMRTEKEKE